jgi:hypothetical protein
MNQPSYHPACVACAFGTKEAEEKTRVLGRDAHSVAFLMGVTTTFQTILHARPISLCEEHAKDIFLMLVKLGIAPSSVPVQIVLHPGSKPPEARPPRQKYKMWITSAELLRIAPFIRKADSFDEVSKEVAAVLGEDWRAFEGEIDGLDLCDTLPPGGRFQKIEGGE